MSLFDLQDVCIAIGSLATLDLPMVVDLIGIYVLKGPYCTLTTTNWFLHALSVIPRGSWSDVARRFTMIRWAIDWAVKMRIRPPELETSICDVKYHVSLGSNHKRLQLTLNPSLHHTRPPLPLPHAADRPPPCAAIYVIGLVSITATRSFRPCQNPSDLLVQIDGGILIPVVDLIDDLPPPTISILKSNTKIFGRLPCTAVRGGAPARTQHVRWPRMAADRRPLLRTMDNHWPAARAQIVACWSGLCAVPGARWRWKTPRLARQRAAMLGNNGAWLRPVSRGNRHVTVGGGRLRQSGPRPIGRLLRQPALEGLTRSARTDSPRKFGQNKFRRGAAAAAQGGGGVRLEERWGGRSLGARVRSGPFNPYIPIRSTTIGKSRVAKDPIAMHTSWRSNSDITSVTRVSMTFRVVRTNQYTQDLGLIHSTNGNHLESPNEGSSIDHQVTIYLHAQNITMFPTNDFASQILLSSSGGLILILTAQSTRN
ncbi:triacylglycerol lipase [Dorcoceras hygrometricum]|uniref:Triacylglycerol lipase n=1 Tax=Dorcoceras hygrometricum TaxID=472368 RepID=A0A2Z7CB54_9LAMI|nr:triacylglycerol lipase [Dorcoceras hygrometricum]